MSLTRKKSKKGLTIGIVIAVVLLAAIAILYPRGNANSSGKSMYLSEIVKKGDIKTYYSFSGTVESKHTQTVTATNDMTISSIKYDENDEVEDGDTIFKSDMGSKVKADIDGEITKMYVEEDQTVTRGTTLCDIVDFNHLQITVKVNEYDLANIKKGKKASVTIGAVDKTVDGKVTYVSKTAESDNGVSYFTAIITLQDTKGIKVGMTAEGKVINESVTDALTLPMTALKYDKSENPYVLVQSSNGNATVQNIEVGINDGMTVEIKKGLTEGQTVLYSDTNSSSKSDNKGAMKGMGGIPGGGIPGGGMPGGNMGGGRP